MCCFWRTLHAASCRVVLLLYAISFRASIHTINASFTPHAFPREKRAECTLHEVAVIGNSGSGLSACSNHGPCQPRAAISPAGHLSIFRNHAGRTPLSLWESLTHCRRRDCDRSSPKIVGRVWPRKYGRDHAVTPWGSIRLPQMRVYSIGGQSGGWGVDDLEALPGRGAWRQLGVVGGVGRGVPGALLLQLRASGRARAKRLSVSLLTAAAGYFVESPPLTLPRSLYNPRRRRPCATAALAGRTRRCGLSRRS